jgi:hypothetical protein
LISERIRLAIWVALETCEEGTDIGGIGVAVAVEVCVACLVRGHKGDEVGLIGVSIVVEIAGATRLARTGVAARICAAPCALLQGAVGLGGELTDERTIFVGEAATAARGWGRWAWRITIGIGTAPDTANFETCPEGADFTRDCAVCRAAGAAGMGCCSWSWGRARCRERLRRRPE